VDVRQLKALVTVVETGSVTRAAELLHLVQPAVTRQIRALEHELGVPLFERTRQGMRPTEAGVSLAERARRALTELDRARAELAPAPGMVTGLVSVGLLESSAGQPVTLASAAEHPMVMPAPGHALRVLIDRAVAQAQAGIHIAVQTNSMTLQKQLVRGGHGWTILPGAGIGTDITPSALSAAPLAEPEVYRSIAIGSPRAAPITSAARVVADELVRQVHIAAKRSQWPSAQLYEA
jgi:DNA-binding transcriptional LysR family regulator